MTKYQTICNVDRERICNSYLGGNTVSQIAKTFDMKRTTVHHIVQKFLKSGVTESERKGGCRLPKLNDDHKNQIKLWVDENCSLSLKKISEMVLAEFGIKICKATVMKILKKFHYSIKRIHFIPERRNCQSTIDIRRDFALKFVALPNVFPEEKLVFIDEVGFNVSMRTTRGRSLVGTPAIMTIPSLHSRNISICCAMNKNGIIHFSSQSKPFNSDSFQIFIGNLLKTLNDKNMNDGVFIMDNVRFHKSKEVQRVITESTYSVLFLPPIVAIPEPYRKHVQQMEGICKKRKSRHRMSFTGNH